MRLRTFRLVTLIGVTLTLGARPALADVPSAKITYPVIGDPGRAAVALDEYRQAHRERVAGGVLIASCVLPLVIGAMGLPSLSRRNVEGGTGNGTIDMVFVGAFAVGVSCELIGIPLAITGLTGPMTPPSASSWTFTPSDHRAVRGLGLSWSF